MTTTCKTCAKPTLHKHEHYCSKKCRKVYYSYNPKQQSCLRKLLALEVLASRPGTAGEALAARHGAQRMRLRLGLRIHPTHQRAKRVLLLDLMTHSQWSVTWWNGKRKLATPFASRNDGCTVWLKSTSVWASKSTNVRKSTNIASDNRNITIDWIVDQVNKMCAQLA